MAAESTDRGSAPIQRQPFAGVTSRTLEGSGPTGTRPGIRPPEGAPNVLLVLIDDAGFGNPSTLGGPINTPTYTRMADEGLRYSPLPCHRGLLAHAGRRSSRAGTSTVSASGSSASSPARSRAQRDHPRATARPSRVLQENGYMTGCFGKWHLTP